MQGMDHMPLKLVGALALAASGIIAGAVYSRTERQKVCQVQALIDALDNMKSGIEMARTPLPRLITLEAGRKSAVSQVFYTIEKLTGENAGFPEALRTACALIQDSPSQDVMLSLLSAVGRLEADEALRRIAISRGMLEKRHGYLSGRNLEKIPVVRKIWICAGVCAAVLLI